MQFEIMGCRIKISFCFVLFLTTVMIMDKSGAIIWSMAAAITHELAHVFMMIVVGNRPKEINCSLFDINICDSSRMSGNYKKDILILIAGPTSNFFMGLMYYCLYIITREEFLLIPCIENVVIGALNSLPIASLDGGQLLYIIVSTKINVQMAERVVQIVSIIFILPLFILGFYMLIQSKYNFSMLLVASYLIFVVISKTDKVY